MVMTERETSMEVSDSPLVSLILSGPNSITAKHAEAQTLSAHDYLSSLTSRSIVDLRSQPAALATVKSSLNTQLSSLCSQHVSSFAQVHRATSSLPSSLNSLDTALQSLIEKDLPALSNVAQQFSQQIEAPLQAKEKAQNLMSQYDAMLKDLLDIPRLLMTCVRANHPVEALQLAVHMMKIVAQNKHSIVHKALQEECWTHLKRLREDLLRRLGARGLRLPAAKRLVSLLRKFKEIDDAGKGQDVEGIESSSAEKLSLSDSTICLSFLRSRWTLIESLTSNASAAKSTSILSLHLSTWRDVVGDTCGLAQALFGNSSIDEEDELSPDTLVFLFSHQALSTLQHILSEAIPSLREEATSLQENFDTLAAIHTQLAYTAASLARQGLEISRIAAGQDVLEKEVITLWSIGMTNSRDTFDRSRLGKNASDCLSWIDIGKVQETLSHDLSSFSAVNEWSAHARRFPDLVTFVNGMLQCYNALLSFAPQTTGRQIIEALDSTLSQMVASLLAAVEQNVLVEPKLSLASIMSSNLRSRYFENDPTRQSEANMAILGRMLSTLCEGAIPYLRGLLLDLYGIDNEEHTTLSEVIKKAMDWARQAEDAWLKGEETRKERVRVEEEELAAEERRQREEERLRQAELEKKRAEEAARREEEEARQEKQRLIDLKQAEEAEAERKRLAEIKEARMREEALQREKERIEAEEVKRKQEEEAKKRQEEEAEVERVKQGQAEAEVLKIREAEEVMRKAREAEEEAAIQKEAEAKESEVTRVETGALNNDGKGDDIDKEEQDDTAQKDDSDVIETPHNEAEEESEKAATEEAGTESTLEAEIGEEDGQDAQAASA